MTSTADTTQHPEVSEISDLTEGLLSAFRASEVRRHLAACELCAETHDSLEEVRGLLGAMPTPEPMPADIAARIDAALAAETYAPTEPAVDASADTSGFHVSAAEEPVVVSRETATGASAATGPSSLSSGAPASNRPAGRPSASTGPGRRPSTRRRRGAVILGTAFGAAVIGASVFFLQAVDPSGDSHPKSASNGVSAADSGGDSYADDTLEVHVQDLLGREPGQDNPGVKKLPPEADTKSSSEALNPDADASRSPLQAPTVVVPPCVQQATGRTTPALALDEGVYEGKNAYLVVLPHASDSSRVQAYLVAATCVDTAPESPGQLLLTRAYDRP
ncbi:anti-sigma factor family protein [Streptomyces californicus]|uniref:anti-sigma factor family protein n=1 Tax=Streptomyces californicus TaxID=67351 RepID=UPI003663CF19